MSLELNWHALDAELTQSVITALTAAFQSTARPDFLGPLAVTAFSFGEKEPEMEVVQVRDVYKEFLEVDGDDDAELELEMAARRNGAARREEGDWELGGSDYYDQGRSNSYPDSASQYGGAFRRRPAPNLPPSSSLFSPGLHPHTILSPSQTPPLDSHPSYAPSSTPPSTLPPSSSSSAPSLQVHLRIAYSGNLTLGLSTSLLINYPSPRFMSLPLSLTVTSLAFEGVLVIAFEGDRQRVHLSFLDPGPTVGGVASAGARLLKSATVESEVGDGEAGAGGKNGHVLKNVGKVEKFVLEVVRSTLQSEVVFP